ncbi:hypothetical protein [Leifsonia aquatica]|uniref:hypothetical protein n=1 Tax=Leifsonia aquatica TaxID=144185 RepID=UPI0028AC05DB|nr:hypothetical protein [Leifsonia aquatica]
MGALAPPVRAVVDDPAATVLDLQARIRSMQGVDLGNSSPPNANAYAVTTHCRSVVEMPRSCWAWGSAMVTIEESRVSMSSQTTMTARIAQRFESVPAAVSA